MKTDFLKLLDVRFTKSLAPDEFDKLLGVWADRVDSSHPINDTDLDFQLMVHLVFPLFDVKVRARFTVVLVSMEFIEVFAADVMATVHFERIAVRTVNRHIAFVCRQGFLRIEE